jgi:hypothetical protein
MEKHEITDAEIDEAGHKIMLEARARSVQQADALIDAGWKFELPELVNGWKNGETEPWQWYWRRPPRRKGSKGRRFLSTNQAYMHLRKSKPELPEIYT